MIYLKINVDEIIKKKIRIGDLRVTGLSSKS